MKANELTTEQLREGIYIPSIDACWLYKDNIETKDGNYEFKKEFKNKLLTGKLDFSFELVKNEVLMQNIEVEKWERNNKTFYYTLDIVNVKFDRIYKCKYGYVEKEKIKDGKILEKTSVKYKPNKDSKLIKTWKIEDGEDHISLEPEQEVNIIDEIDDSVSYTHLRAHETR